MFESSVHVGLKESQVNTLREHYGPNKLPEPPKASILKMIWKQLTDFMIIILIIVAITESATDDYNTGIILFIVVIFNTVVGVTQEYKAYQALEALLTLTVPKATVIRDGQRQTIDSLLLVPGDLVVLEEGDAVPADLRLCEVAQLEVIEAILTGESLPVLKNTRTIKAKTRKLPLGDCKGNAFMTTTVARGRGKGIVVRTGINTEIGKISQAISSTENVTSSIEKKLNTLGKWLVLVSFLLVVLIVVIGIAWKHYWVEMIKIGISLGVSVIPEGLVAVVTVSMALGVSRMARKDAIVSKTSAVETIGSVTVICSDKTGTLTEGKMGAQAVYTCDNVDYRFTQSTNLDPSKGSIQRVLDVSESVVTENIANATGDATEHQSKKSSAHSPVSKQIDDIPGPLAMSLAVCSLCNNSSVSFDTEKQEWTSTGDPTEVAMLVAGLKAGFSKQTYLTQIGIETMAEFAFDRFIC